MDLLKSAKRRMSQLTRRKPSASVVAGASTTSTAQRPSAQLNSASGASALSHSALEDGSESALTPPTGATTRSSNASGRYDVPLSTAARQGGNTSNHAQIRELLSPESSSGVVNLEALRKACWFSCPNDCRRAAWSAMLDYWPSSIAARAAVIARKRSEYRDCVQRHYAPHNWTAVLDEASSANFSTSGAVAAEVGSEELSTVRQVRKDVPRTANGVPFVSHPRMQGLLERLLFTWAVRHPASGYVQGMNDLALPFLFVVFADELDAPRRGDVARLLEMTVPEADAWLTAFSPEAFGHLEADAYWLTSTFLGAVQDNFTYNQNGAHAMVAKLQQVLKVTDADLTMHIDQLGIRFPEFAFRWMNCFLLRELTTLQSVRLWDAYLCDLHEFAELHVYVCAAMLRLWSATITRCNDFVSVMHFLQNLPTRDITARGMDELCSSAFLLQQLYRPTLGGLSQPDGMGSRGNAGEAHLSY